MAESASSNISGLLGRLKTTAGAAQKKRSAQLKRKSANISSLTSKRDAANKAWMGGDHTQYLKSAGLTHTINSAQKSKAALSKKLGGETAKDKAMLRGAQFGADILGEEGLGRRGSDAEVADVLARKKAIADQGLSRGEVAAERAQAFRDIDSQTQTGMRSLQAQLARMGVKGATAGQQLIQRQVAGAQQKGDVSQNLFLKSEQLKRSGLKEYGESLGNVKSFDLGQAAKEKNIVLQSGLSFAQMGSSERAARIAGESQVEAARYTGAASNQGGGK
jgi:hypothetical protein